MTLSIKGLDSLKSQLETIAKETQAKVLKSAMRAAFKRVKESAQAKVPVDTGALRAGIVVAGAQTPSGYAVGLKVVNNSTAMKQARVAAAAFGEGQSASQPARMWHLIELGNAKKAAQPFLRPAIDENAQGVVDQLGREVTKRVKAAARKGRK